MLSFMSGQHALAWTPMMPVIQAEMMTRRMLVVIMGCVGPFRNCRSASRAGQDGSDSGEEEHPPGDGGGQNVGSSGTGAGVGKGDSEGERCSRNVVTDAGGENDGADTGGEQLGLS